MAAEAARKRLVIFEYHAKGGDMRAHRCRHPVHLVFLALFGLLFFV